MITTIRKNLNLSSNENQSINLGKNVAISNDSGIHEDGLDTNSPLELISKSPKNPFQLPSWLANNQPIPDELLAKYSGIKHSSNHYDDDEDDVDHYHHPSLFYAFSFIDFPGDNDDTLSIQSSNTPNIHIRDEIKTCVETLDTCLNHFRKMNEQSDTINDDIANLLNELIDQIETSIEKEQSNELELVNISLDNNLLHDLFTKKLTFNEYLALLDRLIDNKYLTMSSKTGEDLSNEILFLAEQIEQYRTIIQADHTNDIDLDNQYHLQFLSNTQSNYSVISFLQQSISMDMSILTPNELANQIQSINIQQTSTIGDKTADIGKEDFSEEFSLYTSEKITREFLLLNIETQEINQFFCKDESLGLTDRKYKIVPVEN